MSAEKCDQKLDSDPTDHVSFIIDVLSYELTTLFFMFHSFLFYFFRSLFYTIFFEANVQMQGRRDTRASIATRTRMRIIIVIEIQEYRLPATPLHPIFVIPMDTASARVNIPLDM